MKEKTMKKSRYITGIDGLRSLAVIGVILYHLMPTTMRGGYLGVPIFFVISGYLITDLLRQEWQRTQKINMKQFYYRRMKRLYPALVALLLGSSFYITLFQRNLLNNLRGVVVSSLLYLNNWWQIKQGFSYFDRFTNESPFTHLWSLAVEGQNYLIWPVLFYLLVRFVKKRSTIFYFLTGMGIASAILMAVLYQPSGDPTRVYYGTDTRLFSLWMGSALAFIWPSNHLKEKIPSQAKKLLNVAGFTSVLFLLVALFFLSDQSSFVYYGGLYLISILSTIAVAITAHPGASLNRWLTNPIFAYIGKRSYGIYLYQFPVMIFYEAKVSNLADHIWLHTLIEVLLILGISELSYRFIEEPFRKFDYSQTWPTVRDWFARPIISKAKPWQLPAAIVTVVALVGIVTAPKDQVDAEQKEFQTEISQNQKIAEKTKQQTTTESSTATTDTVDSATKEEEEEVFSTNVSDIMKKYDLSKKIVEAAQIKEVTIFGDSVALGTAKNINEVFPKAVVDAQVGRQLYGTVPLLQKLAEQGLLKDTVVIALGTNGPATSAQFDELMAYLGDRKVYFMNVRVPTQRWQNDVNDLLTEKAKQYSNMKVIDWYDLSNDHDDWFRPDRVHPTVPGRIAYTRLLAKAIFK
ncbi:MAG: acyltransferase family protein [Enterococcus italicus]